MPDKQIRRFCELHPKMLISLSAVCGGTVRGWVKRVQDSFLFLDKSLPFVDERDDSDSEHKDMIMEIDEPECGPDELFLR